MPDPSIVWPEWGSAPRSAARYEDRYHRGEILDRVGEYTVIRCETCLLLHVLPVPTDHELATYYRETFWQQSKADELTQYHEDAPWWTWVHTQTLEAAEVVLGAPGCVLDIGTGAGIFLDTAQGRGWKTAGLEPNPVLAEAACARGHAVEATTWPPAARVARAELVHLYEVVEHLPDPQEFLLELVDWMPPGGLLHVVTPQDYNVLQLAACAQLGLPHWWVKPPAHLIYFTAKTLQLLVRRAGLEILEFRSTYPMEFFLLAGRDYVTHPEVGRACHRERMALELAMAQAGLTEHLLAWYRENVLHPYSGAMGRELVCLARKRP